MPEPGTLLTDGISPIDLSLPDKFGSWRNGQDKAIDAMLRSPRRFSAHNMPTGTGKSLAYIAASILHGGRTAILTSTKGLQEQLTNDFHSIGLHDVRGRSNFTCLSHPSTDCEHGQLLRCHTSETGKCPYRIQAEAALTSRVVLTNYAYWTAIHRFGRGLGKFDLLILDEAHDAPDAVTDSVDVYITSREVLSMLGTEWPKFILDPAKWKEWSTAHVSNAMLQYERLRESAARSQSTSMAREAKRWGALVGKLKTLQQMTGTWCVVPKNGAGTGDGETRGYHIRLVWPGTYAESVLFRNAPRVLMVSATLSEKIVRLLGVSTSECSYHEYPYVFPVSRSPVYIIPTARNNYRITEEAQAKVLDRIDEIIRTRIDRRILVHATSYTRARWIMNHSKWAEFMIFHDSAPGAALYASQRFRETEPPIIMVTPSMTTGYDFPYQDCECQIVVKAPYSDPRDPVVVARAERDDNYPHWQMAQTLVQSCGRAMRAYDDACETFIIDDTVQKIMTWKPGLFPKWFRSLCCKVVEVPPAPPPLSACP